METLNVVSFPPLVYLLKKNMVLIRVVRWNTKILRGNVLSFHIVPGPMNLKTPGYLWNSWVDLAGRLKNIYQQTNMLP